MKRIPALISSLAVVILIFLSPAAWAASSISTELVYESENMAVVRLNCISHTDGSFTASTEILPPGGNYYYWSKGFTLGHAFAVNGASGYPDTAGTVTITDGFGNQIIGSTAGDTLTLSTSASGTALLAVERASSQRACIHKWYATIGDTQSGSATSYFSVYLVFRK